MKRFILLITILIPLLSAAQKSDVRTPNNVRLDTIVWQDGSKTYTSSIAGLPVSNFLSWNSVGKYYEPYPTLALTLDSARFYKGIARPTGTKRLTLNGYLNATHFFYDGNFNFGFADTPFKYLTTGSGNISIGNSSLYFVNAGNGNIALGFGALSQITSTADNVAIGTSAGPLATGTGNVYLGAGSGHENTGNKNVFLGYDAGYNETGSNKLYIANSNTSNPLIYGDFSTPLLKINGTLNVTANMETTTAGDGLILKSPNGTRYKLTVDNAGTLVVTAL
jgi:hypothetical protein